MGAVPGYGVLTEQANGLVPYAREEHGESADTGSHVTVLGDVLGPYAPPQDALGVGESEDEVVEHSGVGGIEVW